MQPRAGDRRKPDAGAAWRLPSPPTRLKALPRRILPLVTLLWVACAAFAILAQAGATWRLYVYEMIINPAFAPLGVRVADVDAPVWRVDARAADQQGIRLQAREVVYSVNGRPVPAHSTAEEVARLVAGPDGQPLRVGLQRLVRAGEDGERRQVTRIRSAEERTRVFGLQDRRFRILSHIVDLFLAMLLIVVAARLRWAKPKDPVATLLSFALVFLATLGCWRLWEWLRVESLPTYLNIIWLSLLLVALPALPTGRYVPRWSRWFMLLGPAAALLLAFDDDSTPKLDSLHEILVMAAIAIAVVLSVALRFVETAAGAERQQMKWASLGFGFGVLLAYFGNDPAQLLPAEFEFAKRYLGFALTRLGYVMMPLGLLFSLLEYRLNDADAVLGRSAAYAAVTTLVATVWAVATHYSNQLIDDFAGARSEGIAIAVSSVVALAFFTPAKNRILSWTEARFQGALLRLRSLPERLARWQNDDNPAAMADRALKAISGCLDARCAALVRVGDGDAREILAVHNVAADGVRKALEESRPRKRKADDFPLRLEIMDPAGSRLTLMIGPRSDGAFYTKQERAAASAIVEPLADALHAVSRRAQHNAGLALALAEISARLNQLQEGTSGRRRRKPSAPPSAAR